MRNLVRLVALVSVLILAACGAPASAPPQTVEVKVSDPAGPPQRVEVKLGSEVTLRITTPGDDRAHVHGYEIEQDIAGGVPTDIVFTASMAGTYEVESHVTDAVWLNLVVK